MIELQKENIALRRAGTNPNANNTKKTDRPTVKLESSETDWALFNDEWVRYKEMTRINRSADLRNELRLACPQEVGKLLFDLFGAAKLNTCTENEMLNCIKPVTVRSLHKEVHRQNFHKIRQSEGEPLTQYVAKLRSQTVMCGFAITCSNAGYNSHESYMEDMISTK